ncbi:MAG TPA: hypothetical protein VF139_11365 [Candidatus Polarisedimenticolaceae bacterium]
MNRGPQFANSCKRRAVRYRPGHAEQAYVEFGLADGSRWRLSLLELSNGGICFGLENEEPSVTVGMTIDGARLQVGDACVTGSLRVAHVTSEFAAGTVCGAEFTPASGSDHRALALLLSHLEARGDRPG